MTDPRSIDNAPRIVAAASAFPPHVCTQAQVVEVLPRVYGGKHDVARLTDIVKNSGIDTRRFVEPVDRFLERRSFGARNDEYILATRALGEEACRAALAKAGVRPEEVGLFVTTSCTGISIPSIDAWLGNRLGMRRDLRRMPLTELGCAAGAAGVASAADWLRANPDGTALVLAAEICSLTFQPDDASMANVVASFIFGDGASALVLRGARAGGSSGPGAGAKVLASRSVLFPDSIDMMGFALRDTGFHILLSPAVPFLVRRSFAPEVQALLAPFEVRPPALDFFVLHPGGAKVIEAMAHALEVETPRLDASREVLRTVGNLSSASVLRVYEEETAARPKEPGHRGLLGAMGPGFSAELSLLEWAA